VALKGAEIETTMADARASVFSQLFGWKQETVQMGAAIALPVLLVLGKLLGPLLGFAFWPIRHPKHEKISASDEGNSNGTSTGGGGNCFHFLPIPLLPQIVDLLPLRKRPKRIQPLPLLPLQRFHLFQNFQRRGR
jgi:hypothetical protein